MALQGSNPCRAIDKGEIWVYVIAVNSPGIRGTWYSPPSVTERPGGLYIFRLHPSPPLIQPH